MIKMNTKWFLPSVVILGALILAAGLIWSFNASSFRLATIDIQKIEIQSGLSKKINEEVQAKGKDLATKYQAAKNDKDKQAVNLEFETFKKEKQQEFTDKVKVVLEKVAKKKGYKAVASDQVYFYSANDITEEVIKELDK